MLIERGASIKEGVLHIASYGGKKEICELLLDKGGEVNEEDSQGWTSLHIAVSKNKE